MRILGEEIFVPREVPLFKSWLSDLEECRCRLSSSIRFRDGESEVWIWDPSVCLGAVDWCMDLKIASVYFQGKAQKLTHLDTDIKVLPCEEIGLIGWKNTTQSYNCQEMRSRSGGGNLLGHPPKRWNVCAAVKLKMDDATKVICETETIVADL